jgi:site-specific DNA-methyltransferase (adenine-specific)
MHPDSILIPDGRQRKDLGDLTELCTSISATGLIHPIVVDGDDMSLIAGERRLSAMKMLGFEELVENEHYRIVFPDSDLHRHAIELEENIRRQDMTPAEAGHAVKEYHELYQKIHGVAVQNTKAPGHSQADTARALGMSTGSVSDYIRVAEMVEARPELANEQTLSAIKQKFKHSRVNAIKGEIALRRANKLEVNLDDMLYHGSGVDFLQTFKGDSIDCIITDIPFGIDIFKSAALGASSTGNQWDDSPGPIKEFVRDLVGEIWRTLKDNTHCFIFCAWHQTFYIEQYVDMYQDFHCDIPPWIWHRESATPSRNPHLTPDRCYEYIVHIRKGSPTFPDRLGPDVISAGRIKNPQYPTEKPLDLLTHLIELSSFPGQLVVDPCHGSGGTLVAAILAGREARGSDIGELAHKTAKRRIILEAYGELDAYPPADDEEDDGDEEYSDLDE